MRHGRYEHNIYNAELPVGSVVVLQQCSKLQRKRKAPARAVAESAGCGPRVFGTVKTYTAKQRRNERRREKEQEKEKGKRFAIFICIDGVHVIRDLAI